MLIVERLVPDELYDLLQRVVPPAPSRPQGGGRRRYGDREVLAAIIFVATTGCTRLGRHRWTIERTMSWLAGCRRLHRRYERQAEHFLAFTAIACSLIRYHRLTK
ncbi:Putative transposase of IS4/5 family [Streptomyces yunnanensis]|uniref:Transposase of IS4/5 family n=1 Tax=Streptomyces yunnanensis TaxID=156453 RepID=A0A9X8MXE2_9ACTN|nr:Putative transposase of IS4/5 family [Streptomyces yunnanensis]